MLLVVLRRQRHAPQGLAGGLRGGQQIVGQLVVVAEQAGQILAQRDDDRAGEGGQVDDEFRLEAILAVPDGVGQDEAAFGVGVDHLDGLAGHGS